MNSIHPYIVSVADVILECCFSPSHSCPYLLTTNNNQVSKKLFLECFSTNPKKPHLRNTYGFFHLNASNHVLSNVWGFYCSVAGMMMNLILMQKCLCSCFTSKGLHLQNKTPEGFYWKEALEKKNQPYIGAIIWALSHTEYYNLSVTFICYNKGLLPFRLGLFLYKCVEQSTMLARF